MAACWRIGTTSSPRRKIDVPGNCAEVGQKRSGWECPRGHPLLPGGLGRSTFATGATTPYALKGQGFRIWDDRGRELIDVNNNFTAMVHGHAHPQIMEAVERAARDGTCFGLPNIYEWDHAELVLEWFPGMDQVRYTNSGTEAVMTAVRIARASTGRDGCIVMRDAYHGTSDVALTTGDARLRRGLPHSVLDDVTVLDVNDAAGLDEALERDPDRYAALLIDLLPNRAGLVAVAREFVELARTLATRHGVVLIFDEVISMRLGPHGLSGEYGVDPDLITLGKLIGGGFPVGAVVGREEIMRELDPTSPNSLEHGGTFSANPVTMAAGAASMRLLTEEETSRINDLGDEARGLVGDAVTEAGWEVRGRGSLLRPFPRGTRRMEKPLQRRLWWAAYDRGLLLSQLGVAAMSTPMTHEVVNEVAKRLAAAVLATAQASDG
jgi:glutamate-1-semialdehyde 2,1-aminomutase